MTILFESPQVELVSLEQMLTAACMDVELLQVPLYVLSLWRPWPDAIFYGGKDYENRKWKPWPSIINKFIGLHAGKKYEQNDADWMREAKLYDPPGPDDSPQGLVGFARVIGHTALNEQDTKWLFGPYGWKLRDITRLKNPVPMSGKQGLWRLAQEVSQSLLEDLKKGDNALIPCRKADGK